jgi:predicted RNase H-like HicB family nuclease
MMFRYRVGLPGWKLAARLSVPVSFQVEVIHDKESNSYWARSPQLDGLIVSGTTLDELRDEVRSAALELFELQMMSKSIATPKFTFRDDALYAA